MAQAGVVCDAVGLEVDVGAPGSRVADVGADAKVAMRRLRTRLMDQPIMHCLVSVRADEAAAWSLKRTLLRDSPVTCSGV